MMMRLRPTSIDNELGSSNELMNDIHGLKDTSMEVRDVRRASANSKSDEKLPELAHHHHPLAPDSLATDSPAMQYVSSPNAVTFPSRAGDSTYRAEIAGSNVNQDAVSRLQGLHDRYEQLQRNMGISRSTTDTTDEAGRPSSPIVGVSGPSQSAVALLNTSTLTQTNRNNFEGLSREMLIDYCWEVHQTVVKALGDGRMQSPALGGFEPSQSAVLGEWGASFQLKDRTAASNASGSPRNDLLQGSVQPVPHPPSSAGTGTSLVHRPMFVSSTTLHSALSYRTSSSISIQSQARPPVETTIRAQDNVDEEGNKMVNQYALLDELGKGCFGVVKLAYNTQQACLVAIKIMKRDNPEKAAQGAAHHVAAQHRAKAMQREIAVMKKLRHKNIVALYEVIDDPEAKKLYLVMQYIDDGPLGTIAPDFSCKVYEPMVLAGYARQICAGLHYLHSRDIVHRDIKPDNILKDTKEQVYLVDFGVSEMFDSEAAEAERPRPPDEMHRVRGRRGTPAFMAPELIKQQDEAHDGKALDIWALGVTFYSLLVGQLPFKSRSEITDKQPDMPSGVPSPWKQLLLTMLNKNPQARPKVDDVRRSVKSMLKEQADASKIHKENSESSSLVTDEEVEHALTPIRSSQGHPQSTSLGGGLTSQRVIASGVSPAVRPVDSSSQKVTQLPSKTLESAECSTTEPPLLTETTKPRPAEAQAPPRVNSKSIPIPRQRLMQVMKDEEALARSEIKPPSTNSTPRAHLNSSTPHAKSGSGSKIVRRPTGNGVASGGGPKAPATTGQAKKLT